MAKEAKEKEWKQRRGEDDDDDDEDEEDEEGSESEEESSDEEVRKPKGVQSLIEIENPNRVVKKAPKTTEPGTSGTSSGEAAPKVELSRREREEIEKQRARENYARLHAEGKTEQARADLARLALIRRQREEAAAKKAAEKDQKEGASKAAAAQKVAAVKSAVTEVTQPGASKTSRAKK